MASEHKAQLPKTVRSRSLIMLCTGLWGAVIASALGVVVATFETRVATQQLEELRREAAELQVVSGQYLLEKSTLAAYTRVELEAESKLEMQVPPVDQLKVVHP